tara:strand:+ start:1672 stop:2166 length:495 start_codon:yes stop_codon:yes gene_type:complete
MTTFHKLFLQNKKIEKILRTKPGEEGFSLVELVVVIAVLAILSAVAIPAFQGVQARAKTSAVKNGLVNGVKECIVSEGIGEGSTFNKSRAFVGQYTGYAIQPRDNSLANFNTCYMAEAISTETNKTNMPWFLIIYDDTTGVSAKTCGGGGTSPIGCDPNKSPMW